MKDVRQLVVPGRLPGALVGLVGVLLSVPALVLPIQVVRENRTEGVDPAAPLFEQSYWSWGRLLDTTPGSLGGFDIGASRGLVALVVALVVGLAGVLAYAFRRGTDGRLLGAVGLAWAASQVVGNLARRLPDALYGAFGEEQIVVETQLAGVLDAVSAALLVVALVLVAIRPLVGLVRDGVTRARELARRGAAEEEAAGESPDRPVPRVGIATIRDVAPGSGRASRQPAGTQWGESPAGVGFSDAGADSDRDGGTRPTRGPDSGRFRPPR